jgi:hypothetical protein
LIVFGLFFFLWHAIHNQKGVGKMRSTTKGHLFFIMMNSFYNLYGMEISIQKSALHSLNKKGRTQSLTLYDRIQIFQKKSEQFSENEESYKSLYESVQKQMRSLENDHALEYAEICGKIQKEMYEKSEKSVGEKVKLLCEKFEKEKEKLNNHIKLLNKDKDLLEQDYVALEENNKTLSHKNIQLECELAAEITRAKREITHFESRINNLILQHEQKIKEGNKLINDLKKTLRWFCQVVFWSSLVVLGSGIFLVWKFTSIHPSM